MRPGELTILTRGAVYIMQVMDVDKFKTHDVVQISNNNTMLLGVVVNKRRKNIHALKNPEKYT